MIKNVYFHIKVYVATCVTCQNFTRIMNLQVSFYLVKVGFLSTLKYDSRLKFLQPVVVYSLLFDNRRLDQSQQSELSTFFLLSTDCIFHRSIFTWAVRSSKQNLKQRKILDSDQVTNSTNIKWCVLTVSLCVLTFAHNWNRL